MRKAIYCLLGFLLISPTFAQRGTVSGEEYIEFPSWIKSSFLDIKEDVADASAKNKHVILYFHLQGCPYCSVMMRESFIESQYTDYIKQNFDLIELDVEGGREVAMDENTNIRENALAKKLKVFSTPTILFLDHDAKVKLRLNGYRPPADFKLALDYVKNQQYTKQSFVKYLASKRQTKIYDFIDSKHLVKTNDLSSLKDKPVVILFEDAACLLCEEFQHKILQDKIIDTALQKLHVVRLDVGTDMPLTDFTGQPTTTLGLAEKYNMTYRPGVIFIANNKEVARIDGMLKTFHNQIMFRYVAEKQYKNHSDWLGFLNVEKKKILDSGTNIDLWK